MVAEDDIPGHWIRQRVKALQFEDHTTRVHWIQVGSEYAVVRIPFERPDLTGANALRDLPAQALHALAQAEGFASHVMLRGTQCTWHREINWYGTPGALHVGDISFDQEGRRIEAGVHSDDTELLERHTSLTTKSFRFHGEDYTGTLVTQGSVAVLGIGRQNKPSIRPIIDRLAADDIPANAAGLFAGVHALCHLSSNVAIADLATQPFAEGKPVVTTNQDHLV